MTTIEYSNFSPAHLLACDHALLEEREECGGESSDNQGVLVFWESASPFVVVGYTEHVAREANEAECARMQIPILRRISGGGTVVQGAGCLNYALVLPIDARTDNLQNTNNFVMNRQRDALQTLLPANSSTRIAIRGTTDLALVDNESENKFSGNAQRRKKNWLLFHGTILLDFDLSLVAQVLNFPSRQPSYRSGRSHVDFMRNFTASREAVKREAVKREAVKRDAVKRDAVKRDAVKRDAVKRDAVKRDAVKNVLRAAWNAHRVLENVPHARIEKLANEIYAQENWNRRL